MDSRGLATRGASLSRKVTPIILGRISVPSKIVRVIDMEKIHNEFLPKISVKAPPATEAPPVLATVFSIKIAAIGRPMRLPFFKFIDRQGI
jgi:hypothetical protein